LKPYRINMLRVQAWRERALPILSREKITMVRTVGAAVGAALVLLFLATVASRLTWTSPEDAAPQTSAKIR
jgi:hypothetical protein